jgi:hypothetical protein
VAINEGLSLEVIGKLLGHVRVATSSAKNLSTVCSVFA